MPGTTNIAGLASGIDFNSTVDQLIAVERRPINLLEQRKASEIIKQNALADMNSLILALRTSALGLADASAFLENSATLSAVTAGGGSVDPATILSVAAGSGAATGTHTVKVAQIAAAEKLGSSTAVTDLGGGQITGTTQVLNISGSFQIKGSGSAAQLVTISSGDSLQDIANRINALNTGTNATGVTATTLKVGSSDFRLILSADNTGTSATTQSGRIGEILIDVNGDLANAAMLGKLNLSPANVAIELQASANANLTIDGVSGITRSGNSISDIVSGLTLNLVKADVNTTVTINTTVDQAAVKVKIQDFVDAFNAVESFIGSQMTFDPKTQTSGVLAGESLIRNIQSQLSSTVMQSVSGLAAGKPDNMVLIGVAPDATGKLVIDDARLSSLLASDPTAIRNIFSATGRGSIASVEFLNYGPGTVSGTYDVNITTAATRATVTGNVNLSAGISGTDKLSIVDSGGQMATVTLTAGVGNNGENLGTIVAALNAEFSNSYTEVRHQNTALKVGSAGVVADGTTLLANLTDGAGNNMNVEAGDSISISGTNRLGITVSGSFSVIDPATDQVNDLLAAIEAAFDQKITASVNASGQITITDNQTGFSNLSLNLVASDAGGGLPLGLNFSSGETVATEGRYAMQLTAQASANNLSVHSVNYGAGTGFTVSQVDPVTLAVVDLLGLGNTTALPAVSVASGLNVAGSIGGQVATGSGQVLKGTAGNVDGLFLRYAGNATTSSPYPTITVSLGIGAVYESLLDSLANPVTGLIQDSILSSQSSIETMVTRIAELNRKLEAERQRMTAQFVRMEMALGQLSSTGQFITQQINQFSSTN